MMTGLLLKLFGARVEDGVAIASGSVAWRGGLGMGWVVLAVVVVAGLVWWLYGGSAGNLSRGRRLVLTFLRVLFIGLILLLLLRPVLSLTVEGSVRRVLVMLMDSSASMGIEDPRLSEADLKRAALARGLLDPAQGLGQALGAEEGRGLSRVARVEVLKDVLRNEKLELLPRLEKEFDLSAFTFGESVVELSTHRAGSASTNGGEGFDWVGRLEARSPVTAMGDGLREVMNRKRGQPLAGVILMSDGVSNRGSQPREVAGMLAQEGVPLYIYGVGITSPRDIIVGNVFAPEVTFVKELVSVTVRVRSQGLGGEKAELVVKLGGRRVAEKTIELAEEGEQVVSVSFAPMMEGEFELEASIEPRGDEAVKDNNSISQRMRVIDAKIKVLMVEQAPRWEFRYLQAMLLRDRRVDLKCYLVEGDPGISRDEESPYLSQFPSRKEELFKYDLVIFGDVDPKRVTAAQLENVRELVSRFGGGLLLVAGKRWSPQAYRRGILDRMLPVEFDSLGAGRAGGAEWGRPIRLELTAAGKASPMLRLSDDEEENEALWGQLPPVYFVSRVLRPKPAAEVLVVDPDPAKASRFGKMPVVAVQQYGLGQVMYVGTDNTWRWRKNAGDLYYTALWGQIAQRLSLQRLLGVSKRTQLNTDRQNYLTGDRVTVYARLYSAGYEPVRDPVVRSFYGLKDGRGSRPEAVLRPIPEQPGLYRGEFVAPAPGLYGFSVESDPETVMEFKVSEPKFEFGETAMNEKLLRELAAASGGAFFREEDLHRLVETINAKSDRVRSPLEVELWASPFYFLLLLGVVTAEWVLRKMSHLK